MVKIRRILYFAVVASFLVMILSSCEMGSGYRNDGRQVTSHTQISLTDSVDKPDERDIHISIIEHYANFPGGHNELISWLSNNIHFSKDVKDKYPHGRMVMSFIVEKDGMISDINMEAFFEKGSGRNDKVDRNLKAEMEKEAVRVMKVMPKWEPARQNGQAVRSKCNLLIDIDLQKD